ncbi:MAG: hypothetical protein O3A47_04530, partial [Chloroflexi bacterium]|nr:hypothetical protein [Chloroflexota bacterium]
MTRPELARNYVSSRETERLGLGLGRKIGLLDTTVKQVTDGTYATGKMDGLHRQSRTDLRVFFRPIDRASSLDGQRS